MASCITCIHCCGIQIIKNSDTGEYINCSDQIRENQYGCRIMYSGNTVALMDGFDVSSYCCEEYEPNEFIPCVTRLPDHSMKCMVKFQDGSETTAEYDENIKQFGFWSFMNRDGDLIPLEFLKFDGSCDDTVLAWRPLSSEEITDLVQKESMFENT